MKQTLDWIVYLREMTLHYRWWFHYQDAKTGSRFCPLSVALCAELRRYRWHLARWLKKVGGK